MRKLATIKRIDSIIPIKGADRIEAASVGGWTVVVSKGELAVGDLAAYIEIDSWVPHTLAPVLSPKGKTRTYLGVEGQRLRTVKLREQISQGLLLSVSNYPILVGKVEGEDVTTLLGITLHEPPIPAVLAGVALGNFPHFIPKTDQERVQNLDLSTFAGLKFEVSEKLDGTSMTVYSFDAKCGVASKNLDLAQDTTNTLWVVAKKLGLVELLRELTKAGHNYALQGELVGPSIQSNIYKLDRHDFYLFDVYDIDNQKYLRPDERIALATQYNVMHAPILANAVYAPETHEAFMDMTDRMSLLNPSTDMEGLVFKCTSNQYIHFKVINNSLLLKVVDA